MQIDFARLHLLGDPGTEEGRRWLLEVVDAYIQDTRAKHSRLAAAVGQRDSALVQALAHEQKGVSAMLGVGGLAERFLAIEEAPADRALVFGHLSAILPALDQLDAEIRTLTGSSRSE